MFFSTSVHVHGNLLKGIYALLEDKSFLLPTRPAQFVLKTAKLLLEWAPSHILEIECFDKDGAHLLSSCFPKPRAKKGFKGSIWQKYQMLCTSDTYISLWWRRFIQTSIGVDLSPIFIQYVGHHGFKEALKNQFPFEHIYVDRAGVHNELTYQELNVVRYAAGIVPRALKKSLLKKLKKYASAWVEKIKVAQQQTTQKSKGFRKTLKSYACIAHIFVNCLVLPEIIEFYYLW